MHSIQYLFFGLATASIAWHYFWKYLVKRSTIQETAVYDLEQFVKLNEKIEAGLDEKQQEKKGTCVIVGGGLAGCITGAIMTRHFEEVIIVEQADTMAKLRERTMQFDQLHVFGAIVTEGLQQVWPGKFVEEVTKRGGRFACARDRTFQLQLGENNMTWNRDVGTVGPTGLDTLMLSRPQMQAVLVDLTKNHTPGLRYVYGKVDGAQYNQDESRISGVTVKTSTGDKITIESDLVLDCSGPARVSQSMIKGMDQYELPKREGYRTNVSYATANIEVHESIAKKLPIPSKYHSKGATWQNSGVIFMCSSMLTGYSHGILMAHSDGNKYYIATTSINTKMSDMVSDLEAYRDRAKETYLQNTGREIEPWLDETMDLLVENEELMGDKVKFHLAKDLESYTSTINHKNRKLPSNLTLIGDCFCKLNPTYGQGTQKAVMEALTLSTSLENSKGIISSAVKDFDKKRNLKAFVLFDFNRTLDLGTVEVQKVNKELVANGVGAKERAIMKPLIKYMSTYGDVSKMNVFIQIIIGAKGSVALMHPSMLLAALWGYFL